jgi:hypothetical protein
MPFTKIYFTPAKQTAHSGQDSPDKQFPTLVRGTLAAASNVCVKEVVHTDEVTRAINGNIKVEGYFTYIH